MQQLGDGHVKMARSSNSSFSAPDDSSSIAQFSKEDVSNNGNVTPRLENEMSWDPFSPAPIFDKGYFAGLAESVQKIEENTELETSEQKSNNAVAVAVLQESPKTRFDDDIHVEPIVQLSERSDHVTGEENETVLFSDRAKLYRFESETSQWKERGTGDIKILFNPETQSGRILMRRDQVLRLCANHVITADMKLEPKQGRAATFMWFTLADASDDEPKPEKFTVRFKNQEIADNFKDKFIECQTLSVENTNEPKLTQADDAKTEAIKINFTPPAGSWNCNVCFVVNPKEKVKCVACQTPQYDEKENNASSSFPKFSFSNFGLQTNTSTASPKFHFGTSPVSTSRESQDMNSTSGQLATSNTGMTFNTTPSGGFLTKSSFSQSFSSDRSSIFGTPASGFQFGIPSGTLYGQESKTSQPGSNSTNDATPKFSFRFVLGQDLSPQSQAAASTTSTSGFSSPSLFGITLQQQHSSAASSFPFLTSLLNTSAGTTSSSSNSMASTKPTLDQAQPKSAGFSFDSGFVPQAPGLSSNPFQETFVNQPAINTESMMSFPTNLSYPNTANIGGTYPTNVEPREVDEEEFFEGNWEDGHDYYYGNNDDNYYDEYYNEEDYDDDYADYYEEGEYDTYYETVMKVASKGDSEPETDSNGEVQEVGPNVGLEPVPRVVQMIDEDLFITYINKPSFTQRVKASRFMLPSTFYLYESKPSCPGCRGCKEGFIEKPVKESMGSRKNTTSAKGSSDKVQSESLKAMFAPKAGSWECPSCLIVNNQEMLSCVACKMQKPGQETAVGDTKSGFMFGSASPGGFTFGQKTPETESGARPKQESPFPVFGTSIDSASFATLAAKNESTGFGFGSCDAAKAFQGAGRQLFVTTNQDEHPEEDLGIDFKPIVQLTKVENQQTGEEGDIELFKHRAKLYRFDRTLGQWKERGAGDIKLMHNPEKKYCRVLMRRDQVHKICANHVITPDAELKSHSSSSTSWVWVATADYADEEPKPEQLTVKFKHKEDADDFKHVYDECREIMKCYLEGGVQPMSNGNFGQSNKPQNSMSNAVSNSDQGPQKEDTSIETSKSGFVFGGSGFTFGMAVQQTGNLLGKPGDGLSMFTPQTSSIQQTTASPFTSFKFGNSSMQQTSEGPFTSFKFGTLPSYEANVSDKAPPSSTESILPLSGDGYNVPTETGLMTVDVVSKDFKSQFAPKPGSWECPTCMIMNPQEMIACEACHTSKPGLQTTVAQTKSAFKFGVTPTDGQSNLFSQFAPKPGSWECPICMLPNNGNLAVCASCFTPRPGPTTDDKAKQNATPVAQSKQAFKFGVIPTEGQGNVFSQYAPKPGSWECPSCMVPNNGNLAVCASCFTPRPGPTTDDDEADQNIAFGLSAVSEQEQLLSESMLAEFAPGSWECPTCLVVNTGNCPNCGACNIRKSGKTGHETMSAQFASKLGSWECPLCLIRNNGNLAACSACYTPKPGLPSFDQAVERSNPSFLFGNQSGQSSPAMFGSQSFGTGSSPAVFGSQSFETESSPAVFGSQSFGTGSQSFGTGSNLVFGSSSASFTQNVGFTFGQSPTCVGPVGDITPTGTPKKSESQKPQSSKLSTGFAPSSLASFWSNTAGTISPFSTPSTSPSQLSKKTEPVDGKPSSTPVSKQQEATKQAPSTVFKVTSTSTSWLPSVINKGENLFSVGILNGSTSDLDQKGRENQPAASEIQRFMSPSQNTFNTPVKSSGQSMAASNIFSGTKFNFSLSLTPSGSAPPKASTLSPSPAKASPIVKSPYTDSPLRDREQSFEFSPVVQLSSIEVVTGEEEEKAIYSEHAKLYRFDSESKQWKERGVGVLKLLCRESSDKYRLIMRRDQVHKLCANHVIGKKMELQSMGNSDKAFIWNTLADFSEDEAKPETFAVKFHSSDVASEFKAAFEKCVAAVGKPKYKAQRKLSLGTVQEAGKAEEQEDIQKLDENQGVKDFKQTADEDDDIQVIYELVPSEAEKQRAKKYLLPLTFYCVPSVKFDDIPKTYKADTR